MRTAAKIFWLGTLMLTAGIPSFAGTAAQTLNLPESEANYVLDDDDEPEVTARVARVSFLSGDAKIRRSGAEEWETVTMNLPVVEGDEIATEAWSKVELQFGKEQHLRLNGNSYLKLVTLRDEGVAVSLTLGTMNLRFKSFDKNRSSFEIDAPRSTIAIQRSGTYRIDAGREGDSEIRVSASDGGEARVYSDGSGFTLKNGRSSRIFIDGPNAGEWETGDASRYVDDFDRWTAERDSAISRQLATAYYDKYYDDDIYGADDLNDYGQWTYLPTYGNVWRPYSGSVSRWADWSPYRYGHWRWMSPFGWVWVNDEPWGWATYHHGRWVYYAGGWYWTPYGYYRPRRSWWFPALVSITIFNNNTCWYPLGWRHRWRNYNPGHHNNGGPRNNPLPPRTNLDPRDLSARKEMPLDDESIPPGGVVSVNSDKFGTKTQPTRPPQDVAKSIIARKNPDGAVLPEYKDVSRRITRDIIAEKPAIEARAMGAKTGAGIRRTDRPMDEDLRTKTVFGGREPRRDDPPSGGVPTDSRKQGAFDRPPVKADAGGSVRITPKDSPRFDPPADDKEPVRTERPRDPAPRYTPPVVKETPPTQRPKETPRYVPPPVIRERPAESPKPRQDPPASRPTRSEPPPVKSAPPPERKAAPPAKDSGETKKDKP